MLDYGDFLVDELSDGKTSAVLRPHVRRRDAARSTLVASGSDQSSDVVSARVSAVQASDAVGPGCNRSRIPGGPIRGGARRE